jgi:PAS domain S-box-containing protein
MALNACHDLLQKSLVLLQRLPDNGDTAQLEQYLASLQGAIEQLEEEQLRYQQLFDLAPDGYFVTDAQGTIFLANRAATVLLGANPVGQKIESFVFPEMQSQFQRFLGQLQRGLNLKNIEFRMQYPTGQPFDAYFTLLSVRDGHGRVVGMRWWIQDVTERRGKEDGLKRSHQQMEIRLAQMNAKVNMMERQVRTEREEQLRVSRHLARNESKLRALMQHSSDMVTILDLDTTIQFCSPASFKVLGYQGEDLLGKKFVQYVHPEDLPRFQQVVTRLLEHPNVLSPVELRYRHINGDWVQVQSICNNLLHDPNIQGIVINSRDITDRKQAELALRESELRLTAIAASMPGTFYRLIWQTDDTVTLSFISDGLIELTGVTPQQAMANPFRLLECVYPEDREQFTALVKAGRERLATFRREFRILHRDGTQRWVMDIARYYRSAMGLVVADGVCLDISERGDAETELQRANELLRAVVKTVPVALDIIAPDGTVLLWNQAAEQMLGWRAGEVVGRPLPLTLEPQIREFQSVMLETLAGNPCHNQEIIHQGKGNRLVTVNLSTALLHDSEGEILGILRMMEDRHELMRHQSTFRVLTEMAPDLIARFDAQGRYLYANPATGRAFGIDWETLIGQTPLELAMPPVLVNLWEGTMARVVQDGTQHTLEYALETPEGLKYYQNLLIPEFGIQGTVDSVLSISREVTQLKERQLFLEAENAELQSQKEKLEALFGDRAQLLERVSSGSRSFAGLDLRGTNLSHTDLSQSNFNGAVLCGSNLSNANLQGSTFRGADLRGANLTAADLRDGDLRGADVRGAHWDGAVLDGCLWDENPLAKMD